MTDRADAVIHVLRTEPTAACGTWLLSMVRDCVAEGHDWTDLFVDAVTGVYDDLADADLEAVVEYAAEFVGWLLAHGDDLPEVVAATH